MKYTFVTGLHGNEQIPVIALATVGVPQIVGNSMALTQCKRFIDHDLNKSFDKEGKGYEFRRAKELLKVIPKSSIVIDFHSFSTISKPFAIVVDRNMIDVALRTGLSDIVVMEHNVKEGHALINHRNGISIEVGRHNSYESFTNTLRIYKNIITNYIPHRAPTIYTVYDIITKKGTYKNFEFHEEGFYPILAGEKAYDFYGLKASLDIKTFR